MEELKRKPGRPRMSPAERKSLQVGVRFTERQYREIEAFAERHGWDMVSAWLADLALRAARKGL